MFRLVIRVGKLRKLIKGKVRRRTVRGRVRVSKPKSSANLELMREKTRVLVNELIAKHNKYGRFVIKKVFIKDQKARWGSCSELGNLNFNLRLAGLSKDLAEYVVVHELCHLKEFNHSKKFWGHVEKMLPDYRLRKEKLRKVELRRVSL